MSCILSCLASVSGIQIVFFLDVFFRSYLHFFFSISYNKQSLLQKYSGSMLITRTFLKCCCNCYNCSRVILKIFFNSPPSRWRFFFLSTSTSSEAQSRNFGLYFDITILFFNETFIFFNSKIAFSNCSFNNFISKFLP